MGKDIILHSTPQFIREYVNNWLEKEKKDAKGNNVQLVMVQDILTLIDVAIGVLTPNPKSDAPNSDKK